MPSAMGPVVPLHATRLPLLGTGHGEDVLASSCAMDTPALDPLEPGPAWERSPWHLPPSHTLATLAPHLLELAKVEHGRRMHRRPVLHTVPIPHGRHPVKTSVIRHILQEQALHLARERGPL